MCVFLSLLLMLTTVAQRLFLPCQSSYAQAKFLKIDIYTNRLVYFLKPLIHVQKIVLKCLSIRWQAARLKLNHACK